MNYRRGGKYPTTPGDLFSPALSRQAGGLSRPTVGAPSTPNRPGARPVASSTAVTFARLLNSVPDVQSHANRDSGHPLSTTTTRPLSSLPSTHSTPVPAQSVKATRPAGAQSPVISATSVTKPVKATRVTAVKAKPTTPAAPAVTRSGATVVQSPLSDDAVTRSMVSRKKPTRPPAPPKEPKSLQKSQSTAVAEKQTKTTSKGKKAVTTSTIESAITTIAAMSPSIDPLTLENQHTPVQTESTMNDMNDLSTESNVQSKPAKTSKSAKKVTAKTPKSKGKVDKSLSIDDTDADLFTPRAVAPDMTSDAIAASFDESIEESIKEWSPMESNAASFDEDTIISTESKPNTPLLVPRGRKLGQKSLSQTLSPTSSQSLSQTFPKVIIKASAVSNVSSPCQQPIISSMTGPQDTSGPQAKMDVGVALMTDKVTHPTEKIQPKATKRSKLVVAGSSMTSGSSLPTTAMVSLPNTSPSLQSSQGNTANVLISTSSGLMSDTGVISATTSGASAPPSGTGSTTTTLTVSKRASDPKPASKRALSSSFGTTPSHNTLLIPTEMSKSGSLSSGSAVIIPQPAGVADIPTVPARVPAHAVKKATAVTAKPSTVPVPSVSTITSGSTPQLSAAPHPTQATQPTISKAQPIVTPGRGFRYEIADEDLFDETSSRIKRDPDAHGAVVSTAGQGGIKRDPDSVTSRTIKQQQSQTSSETPATALGAVLKPPRGVVKRRSAQAAANAVLDAVPSTSAAISSLDAMLSLSLQSAGEMFVPMLGLDDDLLHSALNGTTGGGIDAHGLTGTRASDRVGLDANARAPISTATPLFKILQGASNKSRKRSKSNNSTNTAAINNANGNSNSNGQNASSPFLNRNGSTLASSTGHRVAEPSHQQHAPGSALSASILSRNLSNSTRATDIIRVTQTPPLLSGTTGSSVSNTVGSPQKTNQYHSSGGSNSNTTSASGSTTTTTSMVDHHHHQPHTQQSQVKVEGGDDFMGGQYKREVKLENIGITGADNHNGIMSHSQQADMLPPTDTVQGPRFMIVDGNLTIDQSSLYVQHRTQELTYSMQNSGTARITSRSFRRVAEFNRPKELSWSNDEITRLHELMASPAIGYNAMLMSPCFPNKTLKQIKDRIRLDQRRLPSLINGLMKKATNIDLDVLNQQISALPIIDGRSMHDNDEIQLLEHLPAPPVDLLLTGPDSANASSHLLPTSNVTSTTKSSTTTPSNATDGSLSSFQSHSQSQLKGVGGVGGVPHVPFGHEFSQQPPALTQSPYKLGATGYSAFGSADDRTQLTQSTAPAVDFSSLGSTGTTTTGTSGGPRHHGHVTSTNTQEPTTLPPKPAQKVGRYTQSVSFLNSDDEDY